MRKERGRKGREEKGERRREERGEGGEERGRKGREERERGERRGRNKGIGNIDKYIIILPHCLVVSVWRFSILLEGILADYLQHAGNSSCTYYYSSC